MPLAMASEESIRLRQRFDALTSGMSAQHTSAFTTTPTCVLTSRIDTGNHDWAGAPGRRQKSAARS
jgi:hypothetical protein